MAVAARRIAFGMLATLGPILLTLPEAACQPTGAAEPSPNLSSSSSVTGGGTTLHSVSVEFPESDMAFPGGAVASAINNNCLICHSAGMVLTQPRLSGTQWNEEVAKMRDAYHAPIASTNVDAIVGYLTSLHGAARPADPQHGAFIAAQGVRGAPACARCHAFDGASDGSSAFPRITGQSQFYLSKQLGDFASNVRANAIMSPIAKALSPEDIDDVSAYYASLKAPFLPLAVLNPALIKRGEQLATMGDTTKGVTACENCHGPHGGGSSPAIPYLIGQYGRYIAFEFQMWQRGYRTNSLDIMLVFAGKLDAADIAALAAYYQQLPTTVQNTAK
jgi:cytochrome c553